MTGACSDALILGLTPVLVNSLDQAHVENLEVQVKEQEAYHNELQEVERWLLQMSSRMVTPDPTVGGSLEAATQQLARHKVVNYISVCGF